MSLPLSAVPRKEDGPRSMHSGSLKDPDGVVKSRPYSTVDNRGAEHGGFHRPFSRPTREVKRAKKGQIFWQQQSQREQKSLNQSCYKDIINLKLSHLDTKLNLNDSEIEVIEVMPSLSRTYQDSPRQFEEHLQTLMTLYSCMRTHDEIMQM